MKLAGVRIKHQITLVKTITRQSRRPHTTTSQEIKRGDRGARNVRDHAHSGRELSVSRPNQKFPAVWLGTRR
eukprot:310430-Rhodomonas_salina.2